MNPSPAKGNPTWNLGNEMWLGKEAGQGMQPEINFLEKLKTIEGRVLQDVKEWYFVVPFLIHWW